MTSSPLKPSHWTESSTYLILTLSLTLMTSQCTASELKAQTSKCAAAPQMLVLLTRQAEFVPYRAHHPIPLPLTYSPLPLLPSTPSLLLFLRDLPLALLSLRATSSIFTVSTITYA